MPPARLLTTAVRTASARSLAPLEAPPEAQTKDAEAPELPPFLREIKELDLQAGQTNCGSAEDYLSALRTYAGQVGDYLGEIEKFHAAGDIENATIKIHALKSTSRLIGAGEIGELAQRLENAGKARDVQVLDAELTELLSRCRALGAALSPLVPADDADADQNAPLIDADELQAAYGLIKEALAAGDLAAIDEIVLNLKGYRIPPEEAAKVKSIIKAAENFEHETLADIV